MTSAAAMLAAFVATFAMSAAGAENNWVSVSAAKVEGAGSVDKVLEVGETDFHITTADAYNGFKAEVTVSANFPWELTSKSPFKSGAPGSGGWAVKNPENKEETKSGKILIFKVDVEINGVAEDKEETEGAFIPYFE